MCTHTHTAHLPLMTLFKCYWIVFLWELSTHTHTHTAAPPSPPLPTVCRKHSSFSGDVARGGSCTHKSWAPFLGNEGLERYIHTHTESWVGVRGGGRAGGGQNTACQVYLQCLFDSEEVGLSVCLLREANKEHIPRFPGYCVRIRDTAVSRQTSAIPKTSQE